MLVLGRQKRGPSTTVELSAYVPVCSKAYLVSIKPVMLAGSGISVLLSSILHSMILCKFACIISGTEIPFA